MRLETWFNNVVYGEDQLRQRVAFALSEIMVVSQVGALLNLPNATADFHDMLARNAFGNYRTLLEEVTLHPAMGVYLSMLGNQKAVAGTNLRPDENYAREMMQLFSIGLVELNVDGSNRLDASGQTVIPGLINGHAHLPMTLFRGLADDQDLDDWLQHTIFPAEAMNVDEAFVRCGTRLGVAELIRGGITTVCDMYYYESAVAEELAAAGGIAEAGAA